MGVAKEEFRTAISSVKVRSRVLEIVVSIKRKRISRINREIVKRT